MSKKIAVSFVHGYHDLNINLPEDERPALWVVSNEKQAFFNYPFPRNPEDFVKLQKYIVGEMPFTNAPTFKKLPRFGLTGLGQTKESIFAGSWNAVYKINKQNYQLESIITNHLMNDMHGIYVDEEILVTVLTSKDTVVISNHNGEILNYFSINNELKVEVKPNINNVDWRFVSKQFRGSTGYWHFNFVQKIGNEIWLTARNANAFVVVDLTTYKAKLRLMNLCTPALIHDGIYKNDKYYFTSIDGKVLISEYYQNGTITARENAGNMTLYNRDLVTAIIRLNETSLGREPNWCRGIEVIENTCYVTIDGRYDTDLSFGLLALKEDTQEIIFNKRLKWSEIGRESDIRYVTGFDVLGIE